MMEFTTPPSYGSTVVNVGGITKGDTILFAGSNNAVAHVKTEQDPDNDWPEPTRVSFTWKGKDRDGNQVEASLEEDLGKRLDRIDIMAELPAFVKSILATAVGLKPYCYQVSWPIRIILLPSSNICSTPQKHLSELRSVIRRLSRRGSL